MQSMAAVADWFSHAHIFWGGFSPQEATVQTGRLINSCCEDNVLKSGEADIVDEAKVSSSITFVLVISPNTS